MISASKLSTFIFILCLLAPSYVAASNSPVEFDVGSTQELELARYEIKFFFFEIDPSNDDKFLYIMSDPDTTFDNYPHLYLSKRVRHPDHILNCDDYAVHNGFNSLFIPTEDITSKTTYYLGVRCASSNCHFNLTIHYTHDFLLKYYPNNPNFHFGIHYSANLIGVLKVEIPDDSQIERIVIATMIDNPEVYDEPTHVYINQGNTVPTADSYQMHAVTGWMDGVAQIIDKDDRHFCTNCNYTLTINGVKDAHIQLWRYLYGPMQELAINTPTNDGVELNKDVNYKLNLTGITDLNKESILIDVDHYFGITEIYINPNSRPEKLEDFRWKMAEVHNGMFTITPEERKQFGKEIDSLYITVHGKTFATYTITAAEAKSFQKDIKIGHVETGYADGGEHINYLLTFNALTSHNNLSLTLHNENSVVSNLYVRGCTDDDDGECFVPASTMEDLKSGTAHQTQDFPVLMFSNRTVGNQKIDMDFLGKNCDHDPSKTVHTCRFAVTVENPGDSVSQYSLIVDVNEKPRALKANVPIKDHLEFENYRFYYFTVTDDSDIGAIAFQLTQISGSATMYISNTYQQPVNYSTSIKVVHYTDRATITKDTLDGSLNGTFYVGIYANNAAFYSVVAIPEYNDDAIQSQLVKLSDGVAQKASLQGQKPAYFLISKPESDKELFTIHLKDTSAGFMICVRTDNIRPTISNCEYSSTDGSLQITPGYSFTHTANQTNYVVAVFLLPGVTKDPTKDYYFSIYYVSENSYMNIGDGISHYVYLTQSQPIDHFTFVIDKEADDQVAIKLTPSDRNNYSMVLYDENGDGFVQDPSVIILKKTSYDEICPNSKFSFISTRYCHAQLSVEVLDLNESLAMFEITVVKSFTYMDLNDGIEADFIFPGNDPIHFNFYPSEYKSVEFQSLAFLRRVSLYANIIDLQNSPFRENWTYPTNTTFDYATQVPSQPFYAQILNVPEEALDNCVGSGSNAPTHCAIAVTMYTELDEDIADFYDWQGFDSCSMLAAQTLTPLTFRKSVRAKIKTNEHKYFKLKVDSKSRTVLITASVIDGGSIELLASKGETARPTIFTSQFGTAIGKGETLEIGPKDADMQGTWIIGVAGNSDSEISITAMYEDQKMVDIYNGRPQSFSIKKGHEILFIYHNFGSVEDVKMRITRDTGEYTAYINPVDIDQTNLYEELPTASNYNWTKSSKYTRDIFIIHTDDKGYCNRCYYLVSIHADSDLRGSIVMSQGDTFVELNSNMMLLDHLPANSNNLYKFYLGGADRADVNLIVNSGDPHIYVAHNPTVNSSNYIWKFEDQIPTDYVTIPIDNKNVSKEGLIIWDGTKNVTSYEGILYVYVTSKTVSNYSISVSTSSETSYLYDGQLYRGFINPKEQNKYVYFKSKDSIKENEVIKLTVSVYRDQVTAVTEDDGEDNFPSINVIQYFTDQWHGPIKGIVPHAMNPQKVDKTVSTHGQLAIRKQFHYNALPGRYEFFVSNLNTSGHINYTISVNNKKPFYLPLDTMHLSSLREADTDLYAFQIEQAGVMVMELYECYGGISLVASTDPRILDEEIDKSHELLDIQYIERHIKFAQIELDEAAIVYVKVTAYNGENDIGYSTKEAVYKIRGDIYPVGTELPYKYIKPGDDGRLDWEALDNDNIRVKFEDVNFMPSSSQDYTSGLDLTYSYNVFVTSSDKVASSLARCDIVPNQGGSFQDLDTSFSRNMVGSASELKDKEGWKYIDTHIKNPDKELYVTLRVNTVGTDVQGHTLWFYPVLYDTTEVRGAFHAPASYKIIGGVVIGLLIAAVLGCYYYNRKFRIAKNVLKREMTLAGNPDINDIKDQPVQVFEQRNYGENPKKKKEKYTELVTL